MTRARLATIVIVASCQRGPTRAAEQVMAWEGRWQTVEDCYLGSPRPADDARDAFAIHEILENHAVDLDPCAELLAQGARPAGEQSDNPAVERAFAQVAVATTTLAHERHDDKIGDDLSAVERLAAPLRAAADLPPSARPRGANSITTLAQTAPLPTSAGFKWDYENQLVRDHAITGEAYRTDGDAMDKTATVARPGEFRAASNDVEPPDHAWHAHAGDAGIVTSPPEAIAFPRYAEVVGAFGGGGDAARALVVWDEGTVSIVRSHDGGAHWDKPEQLATGAFAWRDLAANAVDVIAGDEHPTWTRIVDAGPTPAPLPSGIRPIERLTCFAGDTMWILTDDGDDFSGKRGQLWHVDRGGAVRVPWSFGHDFLLACTATDIAISTLHDVVRCTPADCDIAMTGMLVFADVDETRGVIAVDASGAIVEVRRGAVDRSYVRVPAGDSLIGVIGAPGRGALAVEAADGTRFLPLP